MANQNNSHRGAQQFEALIEALENMRGHAPFSALCDVYRQACEQCGYAGTIEDAAASFAVRDEFELVIADEVSQSRVRRKPLQ